MLRRLFRALFRRPVRSHADGVEHDSTRTRIVPVPSRGFDPAYAPSRNGAPDPGEIVWTWVPFDEGDGSGKDRPLLVIGRHDSLRMYALRLTSKPQDGDARYVAIGRGPWDARGRESWVDVSRFYSVQLHGIRREAATLPRAAYDRVGATLRRRYGWR